MERLTPWEITKFQEFLNDKEQFIKSQVHSDIGLQMVDLMFRILQTELHYELEYADKEFAGSK